MTMYYKFAGLVLITILFSANLVIPVPSTTATSYILEPVSIVTQSGSISGSVTSLGVLEQANMEDDPVSYVVFQTPIGSHLNYSVFQLPGHINPAKISTFLLQANFKSPAVSSQRWSWSIYNWNTKQWNKLGDSAGATDNQWRTFVFRIHSITSYISPSREIRIQFKSNNTNGDVKLDYLALHTTYTSVTLTPTRTKTSTPPPTKGGYVFPITHTPSPTNTPTNTPTITPTITATPTQSFSWPQINVATFKSGFSNPVDIVNANDDTNRLFIIERCGIIKIIDENGDTLDTNFLNITNQVNCSSSERGLLSATFPPNYSIKNYFYVFYTQANGALTVSRFHVPGGTPNQANANSEEVILTIPHADNSNHNGGKLAFGNDGYLYFSTGDGGGGGDPGNNGQNKDTLLGKILRIDVEGGASTYDIPDDNPFVGVSGADEIWALGLRNPWRFSFDRQTHDLYVGDVGQGNWEEVNFQPASSEGGENYGWRLREGNHCYNPSSGCGTPANYSAPATEYSHSLGCSITGGYVYRGSEYADMDGIYFYGDYCSGRLWGLKRENGNWYNKMLLDTSHNISTFGEDEAGNLYLANLGDGTIYKVESSPAPAIAGCPVFPENNIWNVRVDSHPVHSRSSQWIDSVGRNTGFHMDFGSGNWDGGPIGIPYNIVSGSSVTNYVVDFYYPDESDEGPYPIPSNPNMEWGSDHHILIMDTDDCTLYETYDMSFEDGDWSGGSGAVWDLNSNALRTDSWTSADAAGLPILPGLVRYDEILAGTINHAIRFTAENTNSYIWPARHLTSGTAGTLTSTPPMGARFRLKASFDISGYPSEMQVILRAMQEYGIILADNGSDWYISGAPDERWDNDMLHLLDDLIGDDFEAVDASSLMINPNSGQTSP